MPIQKFFENTLNGKVLPYITQCTLAKVMEGYSGKGKDGRPEYLPPPMTVPLRYCKHRDGEGKERGVIGEGDCIVELVGGGAKGNEVRKNKEHFVVAVADWDEGIKDEKERRRLENVRREKRKKGEVEIDVRPGARAVPGVPIIYVKKSVMVLEEPSVATERAVRGIEKDKYKDGIGGAVRGTKRKREDDDEAGDDDSDSEDGGARLTTSKSPKKQKGPRGPNPLSVKKKKQPPKTTRSEQEKPDSTNTSKPKRRRGKRGKGGDGTGDATSTQPAQGVPATEHDSS